MKHALEQLAGALGWSIPRDLAMVVARLGQTAWPEMVERWSQLTPTGFPVELTVTELDQVVRWTAEVAPPEVDDAHRLDLVATCLAEAGEPVEPSLLEALHACQRGRDLRYGAWLGGRVIDGMSRFKLYGELAAGVSLASIPLPPPLKEATGHVPDGAGPRMIGVEPARHRIEVYWRLPVLDPEDLRPLLVAAGHPGGVEVLDGHLPDGTRRLAGRRLGISLARGDDQSMEVALFASARTLFPAAPECLRALVPALARLPPDLARVTLVTLRLIPDGHGLSFAVGVTAASGRPTGPTDGRGESLPVRCRPKEDRRCTTRSHSW
jgi:hypothetical protein